MIPEAKTKVLESLFWILFHVGFAMVPVIAIKALGIPKHGAWVMPVIALQGMIQGILVAIRLRCIFKRPEPKPAPPGPQAGDYIAEAHKALKELGLIPKDIEPPHDDDRSLESGRWSADQIAKKLVHTLPMPLQIAMIAGCEYEIGRSGDNITVIMKHPVSVKKIGEYFEIRELTTQGENVRFLDKQMHKIYIA